MLNGLEMTHEAFFSPVTRRDSGDHELNLVIVRLLVIALTVSCWRTSRAPALGVAVPEHYRAWPQIAFDVDVKGGRRHLRVAVCPKAAAVADDELVPAGAALVVETYSSAPERGRVLQSIFVMKKVSSLATHAADLPSQEGWAYAAYDAGERGAGNHAAVCGISYLLLM
jgi:hypothetical protein